MIKRICVICEESKKRGQAAEPCDLRFPKIGLALFCENVTLEEAARAAFKIVALTKIEMELEFHGSGVTVNPFDTVKDIMKRWEIIANAGEPELRKK